MERATTKSNERYKHLKTFSIEDNPFRYLNVNPTNKCNMNCHLCYNANNIEIPDMTVDYFDDVCKRLPKPIEIRFLGGEPTVHPDFLKFVEVCLKNGHDAYISTNGKIMSKDLTLCKELKSLTKLGHIKIHLDMTAANDRSIATKLHGTEKSIDYRFGTLRNLQIVKLGRVTISCVLIRGFNEHIVLDLFSIADQFRRIIREIAFRSQGHIGNYIAEEKPYTTNEWLHFLLKNKMVTWEEASNVIMAGFMDERCKGCHGCYHFRKSRLLTVSFTEFLINECWTKGQLDEQNYRIEYMFENWQCE